MEEEYAEDVTADDAEVDKSLWNREVSIILGLKGKIGPSLEKPLTLMCKIMFSWWQQKLAQEAVYYLQTHGSSPWDKEDLWECITCAAELSFWNWLDGSHLFFWQWPTEFREEARDVYCPSGGLVDQLPWKQKTLSSTCVPKKIR